MFEEALSTWRTREGNALLVTYGALIAAVSAAFAYAPEMAHAYAGAPQWLRLMPVVVPLVLIAALAVAPVLRPHAYRLQLISVGVFLLVIVLVLLNKRNGSSWLVTVVLCMFGVQYAFMRWQELVAAYGAAIGAFGGLALAQHAFTGPTVFTELEVLAGIALVCITLSSLRMRSMYRTASERFVLERQAADLRRQTDRNARLAVTDQLTGLFNRTGMNDLIDRALALSKRSGGRTALLYVDLDGFKQINDICGHDAGDLVLVEAALRIQYLLRAGETAGRIGGDEFVIALPSVQTLEEPRTLAKRIEEAFTEPFRIGKQVFHVSASIGMAWSGEYGLTRSELLSAADKSMYVVKRWRKIERRAAPQLVREGDISGLAGGGSGI
ncbi:MAG TPA: GGDEF domain-containing protein [Candidatus Baltobacteraceae bacterium]|nr:GGDEF domain-containing protein [Candidatus Baltobacteraceae bacterium]